MAFFVVVLSPTNNTCILRFARFDANADADVDADARCPMPVADAVAFCRVDAVCRVDAYYTEMPLPLPQSLSLLALPLPFYS